VALMPNVMTRLSEQAIDTLAELHGLDVVAAGLADLGRPQGYVERQISGWTRRYRAAQTDEVPTLEQIMPWLEQSLPGDSGASLIHNDFKYDNLILDPADLTKVIAVLDWEMCTLGDPLMDLGTTLGYWIEANDPPALIGMFGLTALPGNLTRQQVLDRYKIASGREVKQPLFYYVYGLFGQTGHHIEHWRHRLWRLGAQNHAVRRLHHRKRRADHRVVFTVEQRTRHLIVDPTQAGQHLILAPHIVRRFDVGAKGRSAQDQLLLAQAQQIR